MLSPSAVKAELSRWSEPSVLHRMSAAILIAVVIGPQVWAVLGPHEDWPFTSAPMFARYHAAGDPLYEFVLSAEHADGSQRVLQANRDLGLGELGFRRQFFTRVYGSTDPLHPSGHHPSDNVASFSQRLSSWLRKVAAAYQKHSGRSVVALRLELQQVSPRVESREVARYLVLSDRLLLGAQGAAPMKGGQQ